MCEYVELHVNGDALSVALDLYGVESVFYAGSWVTGAVIRIPERGLEAFKELVMEEARNRKEA